MNTDVTNNDRGKWVADARTDRTDLYVRCADWPVIPLVVVTLVRRWTAVEHDSE